ncbi:MAG TPA: hypothetical protein DDY14_06530 [Chromatiaceae bacterium]|nr:MAG: DUF4277 domain-containing protein [Thiohalocapsa sp. PB-PSB1]HBG94972.1 hypothetical protein [Chromatiaceae bacterium]HCS89905.1 hypothetical protein [Chromatiaceae bacterium]
MPNHNGAEIAPAKVLCMMIMHIMASTTPLYRMEDWLHDSVDGVSKGRVEVVKYSDDRADAGPLVRRRAQQPAGGAERQGHCCAPVWKRKPITTPPASGFSVPTSALIRRQRR